MAELRTGMVEQIAQMQDFALYRDLAWEGTFEDYLQVVRQNPPVTRNAFQRAYDMIIRYGIEEYTDNKKKLVRYNFFKDETNGGADAVYGLDIPLMRLVHVFKGAAEGYRPEKRVILLPGAVGSSKSTIARLLKKGIEHYSTTSDGALYTFDWVNLDDVGMAGAEAARFPRPMHGEPPRPLPPPWRGEGDPPRRGPRPPRPGEGQGGAGPRP